MMQVPTLLATYALFAVLATVANIGSQMLCIWCYRGTLAIPLSMTIGTGAGLLLKYVLDKRYIFRFQTRDLVHDGQLFVLYSAMGLVTTAIFWGIEYAFHWYYGVDRMRYLGGVLGLAIGYTTKYRLDKRYVFGAAVA